jgi:hypothetical protein
MPIIGSKHTDSDASALRELAQGNRAMGKRFQREPGEGYGNGKSLMDVSDAQDKIPNGLNIKSDGKGNPVA